MSLYGQKELHSMLAALSKQPSRVNATRTLMQERMSIWNVYFLSNAQVLHMWMQDEIYVH